MNARAAVEQRHDIVFVTLDTLRFDVAEAAFAGGLTPHLARLMGPGGWEARHTPGSFTYAAHAAFFAGFLPTPLSPGPHPRLFALDFPGATSIGPNTATLQGGDLLEGFATLGYRTICIGGVGFFNGLTPLGKRLPDLFARHRWSPEMGVTNPHSTAHQVAAARQEVDAAGSQPVFLFINVSALHQPNCGYVDGATEDSPQTMAAALAAVDAALAPLIAGMSRRGPSLWVVCSDHGTCYGEDGYTGHRVGHPVVYTVPFTAFLVPDSGAEVKQW